MALVCRYPLYMFYAFLKCFSRWHGEFRKCSDLFTISKTDDGFCCSFNTISLAEGFAKAATFESSKETYNYNYDSYPNYDYDSFPNDDYDSELGSDIPEEDLNQDSSDDTYNENGEEDDSNDGPEFDSW